VAPVWLGEFHWTLAAATYLPPFVFWFPPIALGIFGIAKRDKSVRLLAVAVLSLVVVSPFGVDFHQAAERDGTEIKVLVWNIKHGFGGAAELATFVKDQDLDLALFQELQEPLTLRALMEALPGHYVVRNDGQQDLAIFSRYPLKKVEGKANFSGFFLQAEVALENTTLVVMNIHADKAATSFMPVRSIDETVAMHRDARQALVARIERTQGPLILGGDFNVPAAAPLVQGLPLGNAPTTTGFGFGLTFPDVFPLWKLDHLFLSDEVNWVSLEVPDIHLSDHRPIVAELTIRTTKDGHKAGQVRPAVSPEAELHPVGLVD